ncbi:MAG TPA: energy transducer TonB [Candidatus Acidoferrum sp.]|nr:energy transducer TonB [Candidatus Acidoferrum sp.]
MSTLPIFVTIRDTRTKVSRAALSAIFCSILLSGLAFCANSNEPFAAGAVVPGDPAPRVATDRSGTLQTKDGLTLHLTTDLGLVRIIALEPGAPQVVRYTVHIETDARAPWAQNLLDRYALTAKTTASGVEMTGTLPPQSGHGEAIAQFWVQFEVAVPAGYSVDVNTGAGDIETRDIGGSANLITQGGNIRTGRIGFRPVLNVSQSHLLAKLSTQGGHIQVQDVAGDLDAFTAGGHIVAGNITGDGTLRSGGGHIRAGQIGGRAQLETDGGNITLKQAGSFVSVRTGGGQIDFGEVRGSVRAQTGGGGIRIITVSGPMEVESNGGSICLTRVAGAVQAATAGGTIQAWFNPDAASSSGVVSLPGASQLSSGAGDIIIFLPRNLAVTIDALVEKGGVSRIDADPALLLNIQAQGNRDLGAVRATGILNGGGALLKLRTTVGKIRLQYLDEGTGLRDSLIQQQRERIERVRDSDFPSNKFSEPGPGAAEQPPADERRDWLESWMDSLERFLLGGIHEDSSEFFKRLIARPNPAYPELARKAGIHGVVKLQVRVKIDGSVEVIKILEGEPVLADAAIDAVKRWRAKPASINGNPVETISTVAFDFEPSH